MAFDLERWQAAFTERLPQWQQRMQQAGVTSVYAFVSAMALWPVAAAARAGDWAALGALGGVVAGVGGNLVANWLQGWKDEADAARQIKAEISTKVEERAGVDAVLQQLNAFTQARQALPDAEQQSFDQALQAELARLGNTTTYSAQLTGSGASAQGPGAVAAGAGGLAVGGNVSGNIYIGAPPHDPHEALAIYRGVFVQTNRYVPLRGLHVEASDLDNKTQRLDLVQIYVDLLTTTQVPTSETPPAQHARRPLSEEHKTRPLSALEAVVQQPRLVLLGDPGSGKSTFLAYLGFCLTTSGIEPEAVWRQRLPQWPPHLALHVPVAVVLRDFALWLHANVARAEASHLWTFITTRLEAQNLAFAIEPLRQRLERDQLLLLLDGLDEIPTSAQRTLLHQALTAFAERYGNCRLVITCRTLSYQEPAWQLADFDSYTLAPFTAEQIDRFITAWYVEQGRLGRVKSEAVESEARHLREAVRRLDLWRLASNPLLLTVMALVHTHRGRLPEARALLYEETVDILLWRWEQLKGSGHEETPRLQALLSQVECTGVDLKRLLWRLAFDAHQQGGVTDSESVADIGEWQLAKVLTALHPNHSLDWAREVIEVMKLRAGLLLERVPEVYAFPHRTFQEYLAGAHLSTQGTFASQAAQLATADTLWREVILLAVGRLVHVNGEVDKPGALLQELCPVQAVDTEAAWRHVWLAGDVLLEIGPHRLQDSMAGRELVDRVRQRLRALLRAGQLRPVERAAAGNTLARLGDPRFRADAWSLPDEPLLGFVEIPAGSFWMGSSKDDQSAIDVEQPQHQVTLPAYYIARYPVTVAQFQAFVTSSGHAPEDRDSLQGTPNHPVVWVSWHDALAYCTWLTERLREWEETPEPLKTLLGAKGWQITLPSEAEWEKVARGNDKRSYPWGNNLDPNLANYGETGINTTSAVGCFPGGASPYGIEEMSGNVWEWTRSLWGDDRDKPTFGYPYHPEDGRENLQAPASMLRILRGGAFWGGAGGVRCADRDRYDARDADYLIGFRVLVARLPSL